MKTVPRYKSIIIALLLFCIVIEAQSQDRIRTQREETVRLFSEAVGGTPVRTPLVFESDKSLSLLLVSNDSLSLRVDRVYLVDATRDDFSFTRDIYLIDSIKVIHQEIGSQFKAVVSGLKDKKTNEFEIDAYLYHIIARKLNQNKYECPSNVSIPVTIIPLSHR